MDNLNELKKPGLGFGVQGPLRRYNQGQRVRITRGKNKGRTATVSYEADPHPLSSERRFYLYLDNRRSFWAPNHVLLNESGFYPV